MFVNGEWTAALSGEVFDAESPATGEKIGAIQKGGREDAQRAIAAANRAAAGWERLGPFARAAALNRVADQVEKRRDALVHALTLDQG
ncbi:MAG TPA: aldehyde dehydrogenase family protein, partial [Gaiellaceae bacterium]|nr:aldehyde dehydrogenase family protein [Gaiellaceae bacterium]